MPNNILKETVSTGESDDGEEVWVFILLLKEGLLIIIQALII